MHTRLRCTVLLQLAAQDSSTPFVTAMDVERISSFAFETNGSRTSLSKLQADNSEATYMAGPHYSTSIATHIHTHTEYYFYITLAVSNPHKIVLPFYFFFESSTERLLCLLPVRLRSFSFLASDAGVCRRTRARSQREATRTRTRRGGRREGQASTKRVGRIDYANRSRDERQEKVD